jgi:hypothetical protein
VWADLSFNEEPATGWGIGFLYRCFSLGFLVYFCLWIPVMRALLLLHWRISARHLPVVLGSSYFGSSGD